MIEEESHPSQLTINTVNESTKKKRKGEKSPIDRLTNDINKFAS